MVPFGPEPLSGDIKYAILVIDYQYVCPPASGRSGREAVFSACGATIGKRMLTVVP